MKALEEGGEDRAADQEDELIKVTVWKHLMWIFYNKTVVFNVFSCVSGRSEGRQGRAGGRRAGRRSGQSSNGGSVIGSPAVLRSCDITDDCQQGERRRRKERDGERKRNPENPRLVQFTPKWGSLRRQRQKGQHGAFRQRPGETEGQRQREGGRETRGRAEREQKIDRAGEGRRQGEGPGERAEARQRLGPKEGSPFLLLLPVEVT